MSSLHLAIPSGFQDGGAMRFFKNASQKSSPWAGKKHVRFCKGAPKKMCFQSIKQKKEGARV